MSPGGWALLLGGAEALYLVTLYLLVEGSCRCKDRRKKGLTLMATDPIPVPAPPSGFGSSEWWLGLLIVAGTALLNSGLLPSVPDGARIASIVGLIVTVLGYFASRTVVKAAYALAAKKGQ